MRQNATIAEVCAFFAQGLADTDELTFHGRHSVYVERDSIYSYGRHFPMARIVRDSNGRATKLIVNTDRYHSRGWSTTGQHQGELTSALQGVLADPDHNLYQALASHTPGRAKLRLAGANHVVQLVRAPLTHYTTGGTVYAVEDPNDPVPTEDWKLHREIDPVFHASDPGPPPVDDGVGCMAGRREEYSYAERKLTWPSERDKLPAGAWPLEPPDGNYQTFEVWKNGVIEWGAESYRHGDPPNVHYKQCRHCARFAQLRANWRRAFYGESYGAKRGRGYMRYSEYMRTYGSEKAWREASRADFRRVRDGKKAYREWVERNTLPFEDVPTRNGVPVLDDEGRASRTALLKSQRKHRRRRQEAKRQAERLAKIEAERRAQEREERKERERRMTEARERFEAGLEFDVPPDVATWCITHGVEPNDDGTVTLVKAVQDDFMSGYGGLYEPDSIVIDDSFIPNGMCGGGLHFSPTPREARRWAARQTPFRYMQVKVPVLDLNIVDNGYHSKVKAPHCWVVRELTDEEILDLDRAGAMA
jgi:hypothetical protein